MNNKNREQLWNIWKYKDKFNSEEYFDHLKQFINNNDYDKVFRALKYSDILKQIKDKENEEKICNFFKNNEYNKKSILNFCIDLKNKKQNRRKINNFLNEVKILNKIEQEIIKLTEENISKSDFIVFDICNYANSLLYKMEQKIENSEMNDNLDGIIMILSRFLYDTMNDKKKIFKYREDKYKENNYIKNTFNFYQDLYNFNYLKSIWKYGDLEIKNNYFQEMGEFGKNKTISQIPYLEKKEAKIKELSLSIEVFLCSQIKEYFYSSDLEQKYSDIPIKYWIKVYLLLYYLLLSFKDSTEIPKYKKGEVLKLLENIDKKIDISKIPISEIEDNEVKKMLKILFSQKIPNKYIEDILNKFVYNENSKDLYTSPIIKFEKDSINYDVILPQVFLRTDHSRALFSILSIKKNNKNFSQKGDNLENSIFALMNNTGIHFLDNEKEEGKETYELDLMYIIDKELIIVEAKTQKQSENYSDFYNSMNELKKYVRKFNRNVNYFINNKKEDIEKKIGKYDKYKKIYVSNVTYNLNNLDDVIIIDIEDFEENIKKGNYQFNNITELKNKKIKNISSLIEKRKINFTREYSGILGYNTYCIKNFEK
jgi:hypothetical protein